MKIICDGSKTCLKDCRKKEPLDIVDMTDEELDLGACYHNKHSDGLYRECGNIHYAGEVPDCRDKLPHKEKGKRSEYASNQPVLDMRPAKSCANCSSVSKCTQRKEVAHILATLPIHIEGDPLPHLNFAVALNDTIGSRCALHRFKGAS